MIYNRRKFVVVAGLAAGAIVSRSFSNPIPASPESAAEREVAAVLSRYGKNIRMSRKGSRGTEFHVNVISIEHFTAVFNPEKLPFERIHVGPENTLSFNHRGTAFTIVNVL